MNNIVEFFRNLFRSNTINGAIAVGEDYRDFLIGDTSTLPELKKQDEKIFTYNQHNTKDCTLYSAFGALSDLKNYELSEEEIKEIVDLSYSMGRQQGKGWMTQMGVKCVCKWWNNKYPNDPVAYYRLDLDSQQAHDAMNKNYTLCTTYKGNSKYNLEYLKYIMIKSWNFGKKTYGHAINMIKRNGKIFMKDSYKGRETKYGKSNIYEIKPTLKQMTESTYYPSAYLIVNAKSNKIEETKRLLNMKEIIEDSIDDNSLLRKMTNDATYKNALHNMNNIHRNKLQDIQKEINKFN